MKIPLIKTSPKECPFCHHLPSVEKVPLLGYYENYNYYVVCRNGNCKIRPSTKLYNDVYKMSEQECIEKAIEDWNIR